MPLSGLPTIVASPSAVDDALVTACPHRNRKGGRLRKPPSPISPELFAYQRLFCRVPPPPPRYPPPPDPRSVFGRASLTFSVLPSRSVPFKAAIALSPSALSLISTNPKPLACPVSRSVTMLTRSTVPCVANMDRTASSVAPKLRFPTKIFFIFFTHFLELQSNESGQDLTKAVEPNYRKMPKSPNGWNWGAEAPERPFGIRQWLGARSTWHQKPQ